MSLWLAIWLGGRLPAADPRPIVGPGATRDAVIDAYGWPSGQSKAGQKEILSYPQGQVTLENGRVERVDFSMNVPWPAPRPRPGPPSATTVRKPEANVDFWRTNFEEAMAEAKRRRARILALFTGPDWSPASKQFHDEVEFHPDFVNAFTGEFVFLRLEFATRTAIAPELREQNNRLRERFGVTTYPSVLVLSAAGNVVGVVDLVKPQAGDTYRARVIAAVREVRDLLALRPPESEPDPALAATPAATESPARPAATASAVTAGLSAARRLVTSALGLGVAIAAVLFWLVWRNWKGRAVPVPKFSMAARISDAASGIPTAAELAEWPKDRICALLAGLAESDGYRAQMQPAGSDTDLVLKRGADARPRVLVCCVAGRAGLVPAKRLRELFGSLTAEGVETGWFVAPAGFSHDARAYAAERQLVLIDAERLLAQLRDLPPLVLPKVLGRAG